MPFLNKFLNNIASLKFAIFLLLFIAFSSAIGTFIPQGKATQEYYEIYNATPLIGFLDGKKILLLELNHIYTSFWFLFALFLLSISLGLSSIRKQIPTLKASLKWVDYEVTEKFNKLKLAYQWETNKENKNIKYAFNLLQRKGWDILSFENRLSARKGVIGRLGPILVHIGLIILLIGSTYGNFTRKSSEEYLIPSEEIDLINDLSNEKITLKLNSFDIEREADGMPTQFVSNIKLTSNESFNSFVKEASVNNPIRYKGITIYQADWGISNIVIKINGIIYQLKLQPIPEIGEQIWGVMIQLGEEIKKNYLLTITNENGPVKFFDSDNFSEIGNLSFNKELEINSSIIEIIQIIPSSGLIIKNDPSIPIIYFSFILILSGAGLSLIPTKRIWILNEVDSNMFYMGGLCNKNLSGFEKEFLDIAEEIKQN